MTGELIQQGRLLTDKTLYNIRRERRSEFLSEGLRYMDVCRWRAMDQMLSNPYIPEWYAPLEYTDGTMVQWLLADGSANATVSQKSGE